MKNESPIIVTGACGWIGREVCRWLKANGHTVIACDLVAQDGPWDHFVEFDISEPFGIPELRALRTFESVLEGATLIHCAGYAHRPIETPEEVRKFFAINADGTERVITWCRAIGVQRIAYISSIAFYDWEAQQGQLPLTETAALNGATAYSKSKLRGEELVRTSGLHYRIVRLATVFGNGDRANFAKLANALESRRFIIPGNGEARKSVISVNKAAEWIARFALKDSVSKNLINLGFQNAPTLLEICKAFSEVCGFPMPRKCPLPLMKGLSHAGDRIAAFKPNFPLTSKNIKKLTQSTWVDCSLAVSLFPDVGEIEFSEEIANCANYYRDLGRNVTNT